MKDKEEFFNILTEIDGQEFAEYNRLVGDFDFSRFVLKIHQIPPDPEQQPAVFVIRVYQSVASFPARLFNTPVRRTALEDLLTREMVAHLETRARYNEEGVARRRIAMARPGQKILPRTSLLVGDEYLEARVYVTLPARSGRVAAAAAKETFFEDLPAVVNRALIYCNLDEESVEHFVNLMEDADQIRQVLPGRGWISFVGEGSLLSRKAGTDLPDYEQLETLSLPDELIAEVEVPNLGKVRGLGIPAGVTLLLGDVYSGRTELMEAIAAGIYNHIPGDGRELVVTVPDAVYIAADADRSVQRVDISAFFNRTTHGSDPVRFTAEHADAFTSQAAATVEALEVGAHVLLYDESDSTPGFLLRDSRLEALLGSANRHVTPLAARARQLADELGVSIVVGGATLATEFISIADHIFRVRDHKIEDVTKQAKALALKAAGTAADTLADFAHLVERSRWVVPSSIDASAGRFDTQVSAPAVHVLEFGRCFVDLAAVRQLADEHQTATIGLILAYARLRYLNEGRPMREMLDLVDRDLSSEGLECLTRDLRGDLARPRRYEIAAALNRLQTLRIAQPPE